MTTRNRSITIGEETVKPGQVRDMRLKVSESYIGEPVSIPIRVFCGKKPGPRVFLTGAIHGDEVNGTGIIRELVYDDPPQVKAGTLVCAPVINAFGFQQHDRYMPDRRDLNRSFPGNPDGSLASRVAHVVFTQIALQCDYGIDLHTAARHRTNYPNVRADLRKPEIRKLAMAFGCELVVRGRGPEGSFRREASDAGVPTIILEAGEVHKIEPSVVECGLSGIRNVLITLEMIDGELELPTFQTRVNKTTWARAALGGLLRFHVAPGDLVEYGQPIATNESVFGSAHTVLLSPSDGIVLGMATNPAVMPGEAVCHIAIPTKSMRTIRRALRRSSRQTIAHRLRTDLATNVSVSDDGRNNGS